MLPASTTDPTVDLIEQRRIECNESLHNLEFGSQHIDKSVPYCKGTWDGWLCWPDTQAGQYTFAQCPDFIAGFDVTRKYLPHLVNLGNTLNYEVLLPIKMSSSSSGTNCLSFN